MTRMESRKWYATPLVICVAALGMAAPAAGQTETGQGMWMNLSAQGGGSAGSTWRWSSDSMVRTRDGAGTLDFLGEQVTVTRDMTPRASTGAGYGYYVGFVDAGVLHEHRFFQQYGWSGGTGLRVALRGRIEERFVTELDGMRLRARPQLRVTWPLAATGRLRGVVSDELFVQVHAAGPSVLGFDNNRLFVGIARRLTPRDAVEIGYLNVYSRVGSTGYARTHVISVIAVVGL